MEIRDSEKRRARNLIWNAAEEYGFEPDFKVYDETGQADLYWNSIIGAVRKNYGAAPIDALFASIHGSPHEELYEQLIWLGLENAAFCQEAPHRPALPFLREQYARHVLSLSRSGASGDLLAILEEAHFQRALGQNPALLLREREMLDALEFPGGLSGEALAERAQQFLSTYFHFVPGEGTEDEKKRKKRRVPLLGRKSRTDKELLPVRGFAYGFGEHVVPDGGRQVETFHSSLTWSGMRGQDAATMRTYIKNCFGQPLYDEATEQKLEKDLCVDEHTGCHLYYAKGSNDLSPDAKGYAASLRKDALKQMEKNRASYQADITRNRNSINRLTARIRNALLAYLQPTVVNSSSGTLNAGRIWRGLYLDDDKVFTKTLKTDPGDLSVDLLLDASTSQIDRQAIVSAQGYMIAESLTRCGIPVRVSAFCSLSGYTILTRFRDYREADKNDRIFHYFTTGCNRDGLAIRALGRELEDSPCEHRMVILLSDAKPHDVNKLVRPSDSVDYSDQAAVSNTAAEIRSLLHRGIAVVCVFTGDDEDIPAAHTIYGRNFARIRSLDQFADTVGTLIQNQIRSL